MKDSDIEGLVNAFSEKTISEEIRLLKRIVDRSCVPSITLGFCSSDENTYETITNHIINEFGVIEESVFAVDLSSINFNLQDYLIKNKGEFQNAGNDLVVIKALGFEKGLHENPFMGHIYAQDIADTQTKLSDLTKKIIVITHIGYSLGDETYKKAVQNVSIDFKKFFYEVKKQ